MKVYVAECIKCGQIIAASMDSSDAGPWLEYSDISIKSKSGPVSVGGHKNDCDSSDIKATK